MAGVATPNFQNDVGVPIIQIGAREFKCIGAVPPFDHPHIFLDMGDNGEIICPYCSTLYRYRANLKVSETDPAGCFHPPQS